MSGRPVLPSAPQKWGISDKVFVFGDYAMLSLFSEVGVPA